MMRVFVVEDSPILRDRLTHIFGQIKGVKVGGYAATATEAIERIHKTHPDVVVLDIRLEQGNGFQVLRDIKQLPGSPYVIVLTNYPYPPYRKRFMEQGADYFFDKSTELPQAIGALKFPSHVVGGSSDSGNRAPDTPGTNPKAAARPSRQSDAAARSGFNYISRVSA